MHKDVLTVLASIAPECIADQAVRDLLTDWHAEIGRMVLAAKRGDTWSAPRTPQEREAFLGQLVARVLLDAVQTATQHRNTCGDVTEHATQGTLCEAEEDEGDGAEPVPVPDVTDVDPEPLHQERTIPISLVARASVPE
jgi:hypothetical protein